VFLGALPGSVLPSLAPLQATPTQLAAADAPVKIHEFMAALRKAMKRVDAFRDQVDRGQIVKNFGVAAQEVVDAAVKAGGGAQQMEQALEGPLRSLFSQQLTLVQQMLLKRFAGVQDSASTVEHADQSFVSAAEALVRPGSDWTYEPARAKFQEDLKMMLERGSTLRKEQKKARHTQRATADVIGKIQQQMDQIGEQLKGVGSSPFVMWTSYRLPGTPFQISGRYSSGRANIEVNLAPAKDPGNKEAGFVEGLTSKNIGLALNVAV